MIKKLLLLLVLLMTVATNTWAVENRLYLDVSGTSATLKYGSDYDGKPSYSSGTGTWSTDDVKTTVQTITTDATSCANFSGTTLKSLFEQFTALTSVDLSGLNTANVTNMAYMFNSCSSLTSFNLSGLNTAKVTAINSMFKGCSSLTSANLSGLNTAKVTNMRALFDGCTSLTSVDLSGLNTSKVTDMANMFNSCSSLTSVDLSSWDTSSATNMGGMFTSCSALTSVNLSSFNTSNVTTMGGMFTSCSSLTTVDLSSFNTSKVTSMSNMFYSCTNLTNIYVGNDWSTAAVTSSDNMFKLCTKLPNFNSSKLDHTNAHTGEGGYLSTKPTTYKVTLQEGTEDAKNWTVPEEAAEGATVTATYKGDKKVKSVKAVKKGGAVDNTYLKWNAGQLVKTDIPAEVTMVANADQDVNWEAGTYVVEGNVTIGGTISLFGDVNLIIKDGAKLIVNNNYIVGYSNYNLSIFGQSNQTGELVVNSSLDPIEDIKTLEVHSAKVKATASGDNCDGFNNIQTFNVYGGSVDAESTGTNGNGILLYSSGSMNIYGGDVKALGKGNKFGIAGNHTTVTVYGGKLWAGCFNNKAIDASNVTLTKGAGFTGKIEISGSGESWSDWEIPSTPGTNYVRVGY